jgi:outer membrane protein assembly factor BamB
MPRLFSFRHMVRPYQVTCVRIAVCAFLLVQIVAGGATPAEGKAAPSQRPFRAGFWKVSPALDRVSPVAEADFGGWVQSGDLLIGSVDHEWIGAFSIKSRMPRWWLKISNQLTAQPKVFGSWVVLALQDGTVMKVEVLTGKLVWETHLDTFVGRNMELSGQSLLAVSSGQILYAIDFQTGTTQWLLDAGFPDALPIRTSSGPVVSNGTVYFGTADGEIVAVNLDSGKLAWRYNPEFSNERFHDVIGDLVVSGNRLLVTRYDGLVTAISLSGKERRMLWNKKVPSIAGSIFRGERIYVSCVSGAVIAFQADSGNELWRTELGEGAGYLAAGERSVYVGGASGRVASLEIGTGAVEWIDYLEGRVSTPPFYIGADLYFATGLRNLYGYKIN